MPCRKFYYCKHSRFIFAKSYFIVKWVFKEFVNCEFNERRINFMSQNRSMCCVHYFYIILLLILTHHLCLLNKKIIQDQILFLRMEPAYLTINHWELWWSLKDLHNLGDFFLPHISEFQLYWLWPWTRSKYVILILLWFLTNCRMKTLINSNFSIICTTQK